MMRMTSALAAAGLCFSSAAHAQEDCIAREKITAVVLALAPAAIEATAKRCGPVLPESAFLRSGGVALADRYRAEPAPADADLGTLFGDITGMDIGSAATGKAMMLLMQAMLEAEIAKLDQGDCAPIDDLVEAFAPLPPSNLSQALGAILTLSADDADKRDGKDAEGKARRPQPKICPS